MYNFIYWVIYGWHIKRNKGEWLSRLNGSLIVGITLVIHIGFFFTIYRAIYYQTLSFPSDYHNSLSKCVTNMIVLAIMAIPFFYYNKERVQKLKEKHNGIFYYFTFFNCVKFISLTLLPLFIVIKLSTK